MKPILKKETTSKQPTCRAIREMLEGAEPNWLQPPEVKAHCEQCPSCQHYERQLAGLRSLLANQPRVVAPADFDLKLRQRIAATKQRSENAWWRFSWQPAGALAAAALVVVGLMVGISHIQSIQKPQHAVSPTVAILPTHLQPASSSLASANNGQSVKTVTETPSSAALAVATHMVSGRAGVHSVRYSPIGHSVNRDQAGNVMDVTIILRDEANRTRSVPVSRVIYGAQPIVNAGEIVNTEDIEDTVSSQEESTIF